MEEKIKRLRAYEVIKLKEYEGFVRGIPTGMYADRESYGNAPMLAVILDNMLPCKFRANPYSHRKSIEGGVNKVQGFLDSLIETLFSFKPDSENEELGIAAAFIDQAIRNKSAIEIQGEYKEGVLNGQFLKVGKTGFQFPGYEMPAERIEREGRKD